MLLFTQDTKNPSSLIMVWEEVFGKKVMELPDDDLNLLAKACIAYILNVVQWPAVFKMLSPINAKIAAISNDTAFNKYKDLRHELIKSTRTSLNLKLFLLRLLVKEMNGDEVNVRQEAKACEVIKNDVAIWYNLEAMNLKIMVENIVNYAGFKVPLPKQVSMECGKFLIASQSYIESYTRKSLWFIYNSNHYQDTDIMGELRIAATHAYYQKVPFLEGEHLKNCVRRTISNSGKKLIEYYTHPDRSRLFYDKAKSIYANRVVNESDYMESKKSSSIHETNRLTSALDFGILIGDLRKTHGRVIDLLMLNDDTDFLTENAKFEAENCEELFNKAGKEKYYELMASYLNIPLSSITNIVTELKHVMAA